MQQDIFISAVLMFSLVVIVLFFYFVYKRNKSTETLYHDAMMQESNGRYEEAINLYQQYLKRSGKRMDPQVQQVELRIKTLRIMCL